MPADWTVRSRNGRIAVHGRRAVMAGKVRERLWWTDASGRQRHTTVAVYDSDPDRGKRYAAEIADEVSRGTTKGAIRKNETREFLAARDALAPYGVPVDVAAREYVTARQIAESAGGTLQQAVEDFASRHRQESQPVAEVVDDLTEQLTRRGRSRGYVADLKRWGSALADAFPGPISAIDSRRLELWIAERTDSAKTFNNQRAGLSTIFRHAVSCGWARDNPAAKIPPANEHQTIECYTAAEMAAILAGLDLHLVPFVCLQAFGCMRAAEVVRAEWGRHVTLETGVIRVSDDIAKTDRPRIVEMRENLKDWLEPWRLARGPIYPHQRRSDQVEYKRLRRVFLRDIAERLPAGFPSISNGLRKTCASHLVPVSDHIGAAAEMMGHSVAQMKRNYRELVTRKDADRYWSIGPRNAKRIAQSA